jgi:molybdopterin converting factor small subunit
MPIKIKVNSNFGLTNVCGGGLEMNNGATVGDLLSDIGKKFTVNFFDSESGSIHGDVQIRINGKDYLLIPTQLDTPLKDGDSVDINLLPLGGG